VLKKPFILCLLIFIAFSLPRSVLAHSGKTDSSGGHYDHGTGEYHYHHGYSAHDHWDMDDDGDIDCPYNFDDQTNHNSGLTSNGNSSVSSGKNNASTTEQTEESIVPEFMYWIIGFLVVVIIVMYCIIRGKNETIASNERSFRLREADAETRVREGINSLHKALTEKYGEDYLYAMSGAPAGDYLGKDSLPHSSEALTIAFADQYTFYLGGPRTNSDVKYHHRSCRYAKSAYPVNAMVLQDRRYYKPCMLCPCRLPDTSWVQKYKKHIEFLNKYIDSKQEISIKPPVPSDSGVKINYRGRP